MDTRLTTIDLAKSGSAEFQYSHLSTYYDEARRADWVLMNAKPRACFTNTLLDEIAIYQTVFSDRDDAVPGENLRFVVAASAIEGVFNLGGDLDHFKHSIETRDVDALIEYGIKCAEVLFNNTSHYNRNAISISLVQGDALGGGFECALSANTIIAEKGTKMGLPEVLFNLFPGMGAWTYLSRRMTPVKARDLILSGKMYSAEEMFELGVVDILIEPGEGVDAVNRYIDKVNRSPNSHYAMQRVMDMDFRRPTRDELITVTTLWAQSALNLRAKDLKMMNRLVSRQNKK